MTLRKLALGLLLAALPTVLLAQKIERKDPMQMWPYTYEGRVLNKRALKEILMTEVSSVVAVQKTRPATFIGKSFGFVGSFLVGRQVGLSINPNRRATNTGKLVGYGGGGVLILVGLLIEDGTKKHLHRAVKNYNTAQDEKLQSTSQRGYELQLAPTQDGIGFTLSF